MYDYTIKCWEGEWILYAVFAVFFTLVYVIGLPAIQALILFRHKKNLFETTCADPKEQRENQKKYGSIYEHYKEKYYYFELVDVLRRLLLTGGLILMGRDTVSQIFFASVICVLWLMILCTFKPYKSELDNVVAIMLAAQLSLTITSGMALKLHALTPGQDLAEQTSFGIVLIIVSVICMIISLGTTIASVPVIQTFYEDNVKDLVELVKKLVEPATKGCKKKFKEWVAWATKRCKKKQPTKSNDLISNAIDNPLHDAK